jgi:hypothetical protein
MSPPINKVTKQVLFELNTAYIRKYVKEEPKFNPLTILKTDDDTDFQKKLTWLLMQPDYFWFLVKFIFNVDLLPFQCVILTEIWQRKFPMLVATRGGSKTFLLALYGLMRGLLMPNRKVLVAGAAFRQSKFVYDYMETIWKNAPILRDLCDNESDGFKSPDKCHFNINGSTITCIPIGTGEKVRGFRCQDLIAEEFASHNREIFETVLAGFGNVSSDPSEAVKRIAAIEEANNRNITDITFLGTGPSVSNQILLCGTAFYSFNHFADYWRKYKTIINSKGSEAKLREVFAGEIPDAFDWRDYSIIRLPYDALPKGFMDEGNIARSKASVHSSIFSMESGAVFISDSAGFFKRSLIESCVASEQNSLLLPSGPICYDAVLKGVYNRKYVIAIDPASEIDNFSIVVIEMHEDHRRIVHCWTTTRQAHSERVKLGLTTEDNFYNYAARRIRDLMRVFPTERIIMDSQGGGVAVSEALHEEQSLKEGELKIWPIIEEGKEKPTDGESGLHILELANFANAAWTSEANHGMRKDFEDKVLLFPKFDPVVLALSAEQDRINNKLYDTLEDCVMEIEELKNELSLIEITKTPNGRDRWDTPEVKVGHNKKGRMRKDRYSALVMGNMAARQLANIKNVSYESYGGFSQRAPADKAKPGVEYTGPAWFTEGMKNVY